MKRYTSREQILKDIDRALRKVGDAKAVAQEHLDQEEMAKGITEQVGEMREHREAADKMFRKIKRLQTVRLPHLKEKLSEFDTLPLMPDTSPGSGPAPSPKPPTEPCASLDDVPQ